jgi:predicted enzyme related to lactoylglutathione lyase
MRLYGLRIWTTDMEAAKRFYGETLGLKLVWDMEGAAAFEVGGPAFIVEWEDRSGEEESLAGRFVGCSLSVDDIEAAYRDLTAKGAAFPVPPEKQPWGGTLAHFKDPCGNVLTLLG